MASFTNIASLIYNGNTINSNIVTGDIRQTLTATKTAVRANYAAGNVVTYSQNDDGRYTTTPGTSTLVIVGTI